MRGPDGRWDLFYTGTGHAESGLVQRVGTAVSDDLSTWARVGDGPLLEADPRFSERARPRRLVRRGVALLTARSLAHPSLYAALRAGAWSVLGFRDFEAGAFVGEITDPLPVEPVGRVVRLA